MAPPKKSTYQPPTTADLEAMDWEERFMVAWRDLVEMEAALQRAEREIAKLKNRAFVANAKKP